MKDDGDVVCQPKLIGQFVSEVLHYNGQYAYNSYSMGRLGGSPCIFPDYGDNTQAAVFRTYGPWWQHCESAFPSFGRRGDFTATDFVILQYHTPVLAQSVNVYEVYCPGFVVKIYGGYAKKSYDDKIQLSSVQWRLLHSRRPQPEPHRPKLSTFNLTRDYKPVNCICLEFDCSLAEYYTEFDAVELIGTEYIIPNTNLKLSEVLNDKAIESSVDDIVDGLDAVTFSVPESNVFANIPDTLGIRIFSYLSLEDLSSVTCVSKQFHFWASDPSLHREINLQPYWHLVDDGYINDLSENVHSKDWKINSLSLAWCCKLSPWPISTYLVTCGRYLYRLNCDGISSNCASGLDLGLLVDRCPNLEEFILRSANATVDIGPLAGLKKLTRLSLNSFECSDQKVLKDIFASNQNLRHLSLDQLRPPMVDPKDCFILMKALVDDCPLLESLILCRRYMSDEAIQLLGDLKHLRVIDIGWCQTRGFNSVNFSQSLSVVFQSNPAMYRKIFITAVRSVDDRTVRTIAKTQGCLQELDILGNSLVTLDSVQAVLDECQQLKFLDLSYCSQLSEEEVAKLVHRFPSVNIKRAHSTLEQETKYQELLISSRLPLISL